MPTIEAFRGLRYDMGHVGSLSNVVAPPYDVIDANLQDELYKVHPANVIRLILNRDEPGDNDQSNRYSRAARFLRNWQREGVLQQDHESALYVYHQVFEYGQQKFTRRGFMARVRLEPFGEGNIFAHEETHSAAKADRLKLTTACRANLSPIFGIYPDATNQAQEHLEQATREVAPLEATDHLGVVHRIWKVTDLRTVGEVAAIMADKPLYIADGHHRYETACNYRDQLNTEQQLASDHPANYVMTMCVGMSDPGMIVLPTHRLFQTEVDISSDDLRSKLADAFELTPAGDGIESANEVWRAVENRADQGCFAFFTRQDRRWTLASVTDRGRQMMAEIASERSTQWQSLGVSLLHRLVIEHLLQVGEMPKPGYVHLVDEVVTGLRSDKYPLAALVMPATLDDISKVSEHGERMPAKSTYFYPKLLSGLVLNPLQ